MTKAFRKFLRQHSVAPYIIGGLIVIPLMVFWNGTSSTLFEMAINDTSAGLLTIGGFTITAWSIVVGTQDSVGSALRQINPSVWGEMMSVFASVAKRSFFLFVVTLFLRLLYFGEESLTFLPVSLRVGAHHVIQAALLISFFVLGFQIWRVLWILEKLVKPLKSESSDSSDAD